MNNVLPYSNCFLCPRRCGIDREHTSGYCKESAALSIACASIHRGEEPPITGAGGSGTIFISGCNLGCVFCQNWQISMGLASMSNPLGRAVDKAEFAHICLALQEKGAKNINIVTGSHAVPAIVKGIAAAKAAGLAVPVLWNSSAYELPETLDLLFDTVDVFLPDIKTMDKSIAGQFFNAPEYPKIAASAIKKMLEMRSLRFLKDNSGTARLASGVMVRHLVLPGCLKATRDVLRWFAKNCKGRSLLSLMFQFTPIHDKGPSRYINRSEYETVLGWLGEFGIEEGYCQEFAPGNTGWLPDFKKNNPFPSDLSLPVWHWKIGFI